MQGLDFINNQKNIFFFDDESWREVEIPLHKKRQISMSRRQEDYEHKVYKKSAKFSLIHCRAITT